jgi:hypothetical protein
MHITKQVASEKFNELTENEMRGVIGLIHKIHRDYLTSGIPVDVQYFFSSLNRPMFKSDEEIDYLEIKTGEDFANNTIYIVSRFIIDNRPK